MTPQFIWVVLVAALTATLVSAEVSQPRRLLINGSMISEPESPTVPAKLRGFNFWVALDQPVISVDKAVTTLFPSTNMARLVMVHWQDAPALVNRGSDCYTPSAPFVTPECLKLFDDTIAWTTGAGIWTVITGRAKGGPNGHVFNNATLATQMIAMWSFLAARYANVSNILGYEVIAEPRTLNASQVHEFHVAACNAVWKQDSRAACLIGAGKFYDRYQLDERYLIKERPVIYAGNYLSPKTYTKGALKDITYPGSRIKCGDLVAEKEVPHVCPGGNASAEITFDKSFLSILARQLLDFKTKFNVPVWVDQWGIVGSVGGGNASVSAYMTDALDLWDQGAFLWTQWIWRNYFGPDCSDYGIICQPVACGPFFPQASIAKPLSKYLGGDGRGDKPLPTPLSPLCKCIDDAKAYCAKGTTCSSCIWKHKSDLIVKGCDWSGDHSAIVSSVCNTSSEVVRYDKTAGSGVTVSV